jgi:hypothetical protein
MAEDTTLYKVLRPDGHSTHGGNLAWSLPRQMTDGSWRPGEWHEVTGALELCRNGLHLTDERGVWRDWITADGVVWEAEVPKGLPGERVGTLDDASDRKIAVRRARLLRPMPEPDWWAAAKRFVREDIPAVPWLQPDGNPDPSWRVFSAESWAAAGDAAKDAAWDAAWGAARGAAWGAARGAAKDAARDAAWDAAWDAAKDAARDAARAAAWDAAWDAAMDAAWDAATYVLIHCVSGDLAVSQEHRDRAAARWEVWRKGYALLCDADGVLFVYAGQEAS